ncbi:hypothetical protein GSI_05514 [Ganoderma sinense ZZ0214-1]|uniref:DUF6534 domain-containing protein n=1 Tax=Ganoderma sinense ZZ0214-1 TaxID=1077348 RepID=A0A2G8SES6_9APHY|nr:hypothetical protein GSI_05514 [Ganoderma sinense ZZ0214-1]
MDSSHIPQDPSVALALEGTPSLGSTFGAIMLSTFFSLMLYGLTAHQTFRYFRMYQGDIPFFKILVFAIFAADTFHSATLMHMCYYYFVINYFNPLAFIVSIWSIQALPLSTGITVLLTQSFYVRRIYLVDRRYLPIVFLVVSLMLVELGFIIAASVTSFGSDTFEGLGGHIWMDTTLFAVAASADLILTGTLVLILRNSYTRFERTNSVLDTLSLYAVIATSLNTALTVPAFVCSLALPQTFVYFAIAMPATKVYSNSVLAVLNCRRALAAAGSSSLEPHRSPVGVGILQHSSNRSGPTGAGQGQSGSGSAPSAYAMVRIQMAKTAGMGVVGGAGDEESLDAKVQSPERWAV